MRLKLSSRQPTTGLRRSASRVLFNRLARTGPTDSVTSHAEIPGIGERGWISAGQALDPFAGDEFAEEAEVVTGRWAEHLRVIPPGMNYKFHTAWAGHSNPTFETGIAPLEISAQTLAGTPLVDNSR